jgi:hypothetical protein
MKHIIPIFLAFTFTAANALEILQYTAGIISEVPAWYDLNNDGEIDSADALLALQIAAGLKEPPIQPLSDLPIQRTRTLRQELAAYLAVACERPLLTASGLEITGYLGTYNGYEAVAASFIGPDWTWVLWAQFNIAGRSYMIKNNFIHVFLYKDSTFTDINTAHAHELISQRDVDRIHHHLDILLPEYPTEKPPPLTPLSAEADRSIRQSFAGLWDRMYGDPVTASDMRISGYFGTYNDYDVVTMYRIREGLYPSVGGYRVMTIAGFYFPLPGGYVYLHKDGDFTELSEAFKQGLISEADVFKVHYFYSRVYPYSGSYEPQHLVNYAPSLALSGEVAAAISRAMLASERRRLGAARFSIQDIVIFGYYGTYGDNYVAVGIQNSALPFSESMFRVITLYSIRDSDFVSEEWRYYVSDEDEALINYYSDITRRRFYSQF